MTKAIIYLTYNGVFNNTNGIGTQTQIFLSGIDEYYEQLSKDFGAFDIHLITQIYDRSWWGYSENQLAYSQRIVKKYGGSVHFCSYGNSEKDFWTPKSWDNLSQNAANKSIQIARRYNQTLILSNDIPFLHVPLYVERDKHNVNVKSLIALYGSSYIHLKEKMNIDRLKWEEKALALPQKYPDIKIANFGKFMQEHFISKYQVRLDDFVPYHSSLNLNNQEFQLFSEQEITDILKKYKIPLNRKLIFAFGRADWIKGFDILLKAVTTIPQDIVIVLNVVPYSENDPILDEYKSLIGSNKNIILLTGHKRDLPKALSQWKNSKILVCPSRGEPLSNIPFEASVWARENGPILLCANLDGYQEQIIDEWNGFLFDGSVEMLSKKIVYILDIPDEKAKKIRKHAYAKVLKERNFYKNFKEMLSRFWLH